MSSQVVGVECANFVIREGVDALTAWKSETFPGDRRAAQQFVASSMLSTSDPVWAETLDGEFVAGRKP